MPNQPFTRPTQSPGTARPGQRRALLLVNPNSRRGGEADLHSIVERLESASFSVLLKKSKSADDCMEQLEAHGADVDLVMVAGGDGTISAVAEALYRFGKPLAIVPLGTANDLARSLAIPDDPDMAADLVLAGSLRPIDLGVVNGHYFFNAVNIGLGTEITHQLTPDLKRSWGVFSYLKAFWASVSRQRAFAATITVDGQRFRQRSIHITIGNGRYYGGGNVVDDQAEIDNGKLCLYSLKPLSLWRLLVLAPLLRLGKQRLADEETFVLSGQRIRVETGKSLEVHADGEGVGRTPADLEVLPKALLVYAPPRRDSVLERFTNGLNS